MTYRKIRILLTICGGLLLVGQSALLAADGPSHRWDTKLPHRMGGLPSVLKLRAGGGEGDVKVVVAAESAPSVPADQTSYLTQPKYTQSLPGFGGRVPPAAGDAVPVERLVEYALANNPEVRAARYHACALGAKVPQVASLPDPQLTVVTYLQAIQTAAGPQEVMMSLSQRFPFFGKLPLRSQVAYHNAMAAHAQAMAVELGVTERVKRAYWDVYFLQRAIEVNQALEPRLKDVVDITKAKYANSQAGWESVLQVRIELSALKTRLIELRQTKVQSQARLAAILHLPPQTRIEAVAKLDRTRTAHTARPLVEMAESYRPELEARRFEYGRDRASVALARRNYWPDVMVGFNWHEIGSRGLSPVATGEDAYSLAVGVNLPLYRKRLEAAVREAQYNSSRSAQQYQATLDEVLREVVALHAQFVRHEEVLKILGTEIVPDARQTLDLSITAYDVGKLPFEQLIQNYRRLLGYQIDYYKSEALREQAIASLERAVGRAVVTWPREPADDSEPPLAPMPRAAG